MSFFLTVEDYPEFFERLEKMTGSKSGTGGGITFMDSGWEMSLVIYDRDYFPDQREKNRDVLWGDGLFGERIGSYIKKPMAECTGNEIIEEMLYHFGMLDMKDEVLAHSHISTCMMPYITSQFMPRKESDRPTIIPKDCTNLALIGQYVEVPRDVVFTIETSVRTPLEAVYMLTGLDKEIIEVNPARYDLRYIKERVMKFGGMKGKITEEDLPKINPLKLWLGKAKLIKELLKKANEIPPYYIGNQPSKRPVISGAARKCPVGSVACICGKTASAAHTIFRQKCSRRSSKPPSSQLPGACWRTAARSSRSCRSSRPRSRPGSAKKSRKRSGSWMRGSRRLMSASKPCIGILCFFRIYDWQKKEIPLRLKAAIH